MNIIKLNAIDSTNSYLKKIVQEKFVENYTVVVANTQLKGRGQMGTVWESEDGKNLTFSVLIKFSKFKITQQFYLSMAVALGLLSALKSNVNCLLNIKWPNDILAGKDKIGGVLIENVLSGSTIKYAVVGIGLNVGQESFSETIKNVTSLKNISGKDFDKDKLLDEIIQSIKFYIKYIENEDFKFLKEQYLTLLYKFQTPAMFENNDGTVFLGKIIDISEDGQLVVELENETIRAFNLKEIKFANR
jgi:BirA family biotin operon repressor/biotin-[acetyl-CoA-carboxylase] ligase